jgi:hypothetical protein
VICSYCSGRHAPSKCALVQQAIAECGTRVLDEVEVLEAKTSGTLTTSSGARHWNAKLGDDTVRTILSLDWPTIEIAHIYGLNPRYVRKLRSGRARKALQKETP